MLKSRLVKTEEDSILINLDRKLFGDLLHDHLALSAHILHLHIKIVLKLIHPLVVLRRLFTGRIFYIFLSLFIKSILPHKIPSRSLHSRRLGISPPFRVQLPCPKIALKLLHHLVQRDVFFLLSKFPDVWPFAIGKLFNVSDEFEAGALNETLLLVGFQFVPNAVILEE